MKKYILFASACLLSLNLFAQQDKPEKNYLPEEGDVTIGINAIPFLKYLGNCFSDAGDNTINAKKIGGVPSVGFPVAPGLQNPTISIFGKYFLTDQTALRLNVGIGIGSKTQRKYVQDDAALAADPLSAAQVEDSYKYRSTGFSMAAGYEWRRGGKRLQGFWGGQAVVAYSNSKHFFNYGNAITEINQTPSPSQTSTVWDNPVSGQTVPTLNPNIGNNSRLLQQNDGRSWTYGVGGFVGVEYYIAPKIAIGCEMSLNLLWTTEGKSLQKSERFNPDFNRVEENVRWSEPGGSAFHFGTENIGTSLYVAFSF
jgi:hypothetical protein